MHSISKLLTSLAGVGFGGSLIAVFDRDNFMMWVGVGVSGFGFVMTSVLNSYHKFREARRSEDATDRAEALESIRILGQVQRELEHRVSKTEHDAVELAAIIDSVRCVFPKSDGTPRCKDLESPP